MNNKTLTLLLLGGLLSACASQPPAPQQEGRHTGQGQAGPEPEQPAAAGEQAEGAVRQPVPVRRPPSPEQQYQRRQLPAAAQALWQRGQRAYESGDYSGAIAHAERGLRIARTSPELLWLLASSHEAQQNFEQARVFARQGLRYTPETEPGWRRKFNGMMTRLMAR
ncbi:MAG: hypothetical protein OIF38_15645 [Cellvibrionaceae bacterium]|nr:hypothetical protein [Cellvibrionaceae bacterium]